MVVPGIPLYGPTRDVVVQTHHKLNKPQPVWDALGREVTLAQNSNSLTTTAAMNHPSPEVRAAFRAGMGVGYTEHALQQAAKLADRRPTTCWEKWKFDSKGVDNITKDIKAGRNFVDMTRQDMKSYPGRFSDQSDYASPLALSKSKNPGDPYGKGFHPGMLRPPPGAGPPGFGPNVHQTRDARNLYLPQPNNIS